jgi:transglutaminase-like putative cysteine protease
LALCNVLPVVEVEGSWHVLTIAATAAAASLIMSRPEGGSSMPRTGIRVMLIAAAGYLFYEMFWPHEDPTVYIIDLAHFMTFLICCKFFELRTYRDMALVATVSCLLLVISAFASGSPLFGVVLVFDLTFGLLWLMSFQNRRAQYLVESRRFGGPSVGGGDRAVPPVAAVGPSFLRPALSCAVGLSVIGGAFFLLVPRGWGRGIFVRVQGVMPAAVTGFSGEVELDDAPLLQDDSTFMRVRFHSTAPGFDAARLEPYLRGKTFERYASGQWHPLRTDLRTVRMRPGEGTSRLMSGEFHVAPDRIIEQEVWQSRIPAACLFSIYPPISVSSPDIEQMRINRADMTLQTNQRIGGPVRYTACSLLGTPLGDEDVTDLPTRRQTRPSRMSDIHPAVRTLSQELMSRTGDPADPQQWERLAAGVVGFLQSDDFVYTLRRPKSNAETDPVKNFLFDNPRGHCEFFASAMVLLCQAADIPSRMVTGYYGGEFNPVGGFHRFRQKDAHAWAEVFLPDRGWTTFDPSPPREAEDDDAAASMWGRVRRLVDFVQFKWSMLVVSFDSASRQTLVDRFNLWLSRLGRQGEDSTRTPKDALVDVLWGPRLLPLWQRVFYWLLMVLVVTLIVLVVRALAIVSLMIKERLPLRRRHSISVVRRSGARFYDRLLLLLAAKGHVKPPHQTPYEFAADLARTNPQFADLPSFVRGFYEAQFGQRELPPEQLASIREFLKRLREEPAFGMR